MSLFVLLSRSMAADPDSEIHRWLTAAGLSVIDHTLGSAPAVEFGLIQAALIEVDGKGEAALLQTRRWRAELGDDLVPIIWLLSGTSTELIANGLEAGADVVLAQTVEKDSFVAQIRAAARMRSIALRVLARAHEARILGEQLQKAYRQIDREVESARRIQLAFLPQTFPTLGSARFAVSHRQRNRVGGDFFGAREIDENHVGLFVGDVVGGGSTGGLTGLFASQSVVMSDFIGGEKLIFQPGEVLSRVNRALLGLGIEDRPMVAMLAATLQTSTGELRIARGGLPNPLHLPLSGKPRQLAIPGPFLGTAETNYSSQTVILQPGDRLVIGTHGIRQQSDLVAGLDDEILEVVSRHRTLSGQAFVDAIANDLLVKVRHSEDFTLLCVEMVAEK